jgi:hypothetical protein
VGSVAALVVGLAGAPVARANSAELFGMGSRYSGMGDAATALSFGPSAAFHNPAGVANGRQAEFHFSSTAYIGWLKIRDARESIENPYEFAVGLTVPVPFEGKLADRVWVGLLVSAHPDIVARVISHLPTDPFYPYFDNRTQRVVVLPTGAVRLLDSSRWGRLTLGLGLNVFAGLDGVIVGTEGASRSLEARVSQTLGGSFGFNAGARYSYRWLHVGLAYRQQFSMRFRTDSYNFVAGADLNLNIDAEGLFSPHIFALGLAATPAPDLAVALDVTYALWRLYEGPYVEVSSVLPLVGSLTGDTPEIQFRDAVGVKAGVEYRVALPRGIHLPLRLGLGFESSPVPDQGGRTNMLDGHKLVVSAGIGVDMGLLLGRRVWLDMHLRMHALIPRTFEKRIVVPQPECPAGPSPVSPDDALGDEVPCDRTNDETLGLQLSNPGYPRLRASGFVLSGGITLGIELGSTQKAIENVPGKARERSPGTSPGASPGKGDNDPSGAGTDGADGTDMADTPPGASPGSRPADVAPRARPETGPRSEGQPGPRTRTRPRPRPRTRPRPRPRTRPRPRPRTRPRPRPADPPINIGGEDA